MTSNPAGISAVHYADAETIWDYHQMRHRLRRSAAAIGLGSHDLGVAMYAAKLYHLGFYPLIVFIGANSPTTAARFPRGEAVHYRDRAVELGVPGSTIIVEPRATNTGENITFARQALQAAGVRPDSVLLISKPYMERRAFATCRKAWPEIEVTCTSEPLSFSEYVTEIGSAKLVIDMLVGDFQRIIEYPAQGYAIAQDIPACVDAAYQRLLAAGYDSQLLGR